MCSDNKEDSDLNILLGTGLICLYWTETVARWEIGIRKRERGNNNLEETALSQIMLAMVALQGLIRFFQFCFLSVGPEMAV